MDPKSGKPPLIFVNPFAIWTELALKTGEAMMASVRAAAPQENPPKVAAIPPADTPPPEAEAPASPVAKRTRKAQASRGKSVRAKPRVKAKGKTKKRARR